MRWFRDHIRRGSWFALIALAINFGLSFGHIHAVDGGGFGHRFALQIAAIASPDDGQSQGRHRGDAADLLCPICMATSAMANALASVPPAMAHPIAHIAVDRTAQPTVALFESSRAAFQSRAPPVS